MDSKQPDNLTNLWYLEDLYLDDFHPDGWYPGGRNNGPPLSATKSKGYWCHICGTTDEERFQKYMMPNTCLKCIKDLSKKADNEEKLFLDSCKF